MYYRRGLRSFTVKFITNIRIYLLYVLFKSTTCTDHLMEKLLRFIGMPFSYFKVSLKIVLPSCEFCNSNKARTLYSWFNWLNNNFSRWKVVYSFNIFSCYTLFCTWLWINCAENFNETISRAYALYPREICFLQLLQYCVLLKSCYFKTQPSNQNMA